MNFRLRTPLYKAVYVEDAKAVRLLLNHGAEVSLGDEYLQTPLHLAAVNGRDLGRVRFFLSHEPDVNAQDNYKYTALHKPSVESDPTIIRLLLQYHANVNARNYKWQTPLHDALKSFYLFDRCYAKNYRLLLEHGADDGVKDHNGNTPLHLAVQCKECVALLLEYNADILANNDDGMTPLQIVENKEVKCLLQERMDAVLKVIDLRALDNEQRKAKS
ncbi:MAG: hypothetical protein Q9187_008872 [Circinaria calcarea]